MTNKWLTLKKTTRLCIIDIILKSVPINVQGIIDIGKKLAILSILKPTNNFPQLGIFGSLAD